MRTDRGCPRPSRGVDGEPKRVAGYVRADGNLQTERVLRDDFLCTGLPERQRPGDSPPDADVVGAMFHWTPDPDADVLRPDRELTPAAFERYERAADAGLRLAFAHAGLTGPDGDPPEPVE